MDEPGTTAPAPLRTTRLGVRVPADLKAVIQHAADLTGQSLSGFVVNSAYKAAGETIREHETITLSVRDGKRLHEALLRQAGPIEELTAAAQRRAKALSS